MDSANPQKRLDHLGSQLQAQVQWSSGTHGRQRHRVDDSTDDNHLSGLPPTPWMSATVYQAADPRLDAGEGGRP